MKEMLIKVLKKKEERKMKDEFRNEGSERRKKDIKRMIEGKMSELKGIGIEWIKRRIKWNEILRIVGEGLRLEKIGEDEREIK